MTIKHKPKFTRTTTNTIIIFVYSKKYIGNL